MLYEESGERKIIMKMSILLFNLRSRRLGIDTSTERDANVDIVAPMLGLNESNWTIE